MVIPHAKSGDVIDVRPFGAALSTTFSYALFKSAGLEVIRLVLRAGEELPAHAVPGEIVLQCIEGRVALDCDAGMRELAAGQLMRITGNKIHALRGIENTSLLLTIAFKQ